MILRTAAAGIIAVIVAIPAPGFGGSGNDGLMAGPSVRRGLAGETPAQRPSTWQVAQAPRKNTQAQAPQPAAPAQEPAAAPPPAPIRTEILKFDNWTATCHEYAEGTRKRNCTAQLQVQQSGSNQIIFSWIIVINDNKQLVTLLQTPTGVAIAPGVKLRLEKAAERTIPFESCDTGNCLATQIIDNTMLRDMSAAANVQVTVQAINGNQVNFNFPLKGIDKALAHLRSKL